MKHFLPYLLTVVLAVMSATQVCAADRELKPRIVILTDIAPADIEPDDMESLIRLLAHADLYEIEAIITGSGWNSSGREYPDAWGKYAYDVIDAYDKDVTNLMKRSGQTSFMPADKENKSQRIGYWPSPDYLRGRTMPGSRNLGVASLGENNRSQGSDFIIQLALEKDPRPLWILAWGGANTLAQSLWQLNDSGDSRRLNSVLDKIRVYTITDQDMNWHQRDNFDLSSHKWMRSTFGDRLFFIWDENAWLVQNYTGSANWNEYQDKIQGHGYLGKIYPRYKWGVEGDSPSFFYLMPNGLNDPDIPSQGSWGGFFRKALSADSLTTCHTNTPADIHDISETYGKRFYPAIFDNFAARMEWATTGSGNRNPITVINGRGGLSPIVINAKGKKSVTLDSKGSYDPDNDTIDIKWWLIPEAGNGPDGIIISESDGPMTSVILTDGAKGKTYHIICEVTDNGPFRLKSYRRIILKC